MNERLYRVTMHPLEPTCMAVGLMLEEGELRELTSAMNYGSGWFAHRNGETTTWFNLRGIASVTIERMEGETK